MSRRPKLDISAVNKVDAVPLRKALELHQKALAELAKGRARQDALNKEIADWMENTDPDDTERIQLISGKKIQADIIPGLIRRNEIQFTRDLSPALLSEADKFKSALRRFYEQANEAICVQVAEVLRPYFTIRTHANGEKHDRAMDFARQSDDCWGIHARLGRLESIRLSDASRPGDFAEGENYDRDLAQSATALLMLAEEA
jgi:hypothetical protein